MPKRLTQIIFFVVGFLLFYCVTVYALNSIHWRGFSLLQKLTGNFRTAGAYGQTLQRFREVENYRNIDVLVAGSSHAYRGFDPRLFREYGLTSFNLGSTSQSPMNTFFMLERYISKLNPKLVVLEVYPEILTLDGLESFYDLLVNLPASKEMFKMALATRNPHAVNLLLGNYLGRWDAPLQLVDQRPVEGEKYIAGGYCESLGVRGELLQVSTPSGKSFEIKERQLEYLGEIVSLVKSYGIELLLVIHPLPDDTLSRVSNYQAIVGTLRHLARNHEVDFFDYSSQLALDPVGDFMDADHLNSSGVLKFNRALLEKLADHPRFRHMFPEG